MILEKGLPTYGVLSKLVLFSRSVVSDSLWPYGLQHAKLPCPSPSHRDCSNYVPWVSDAIQPSYPLLSPSPPASIFPSIRVFSNESDLHIRWPKYWSFSISSSNDYSGWFLPTFWIMQGYWNTNYRTIALISLASKVMLKILQARLQQLWTSWCSSWF